MTDPIKRIQELQRIIRSSNDHEALAELLILRSRVEGEQVYLEALQDRLLWNRYPSSIQDRAIELVGRSLAGDFRHSKTEFYECAVTTDRVTTDRVTTDHVLSHRIASFEHVKSGALLNLIPGGTYQMGTEDTEAELLYCVGVIRGEDFEDSGEEYIAWDTPAHRVTIPPFLIGRYPLRQSVWSRLDKDSGLSWTGGDRPVDRVEWRRCHAWLEQAGDGLRLPSESEWEYACRAGSTTRYYWGDELDESYCWLDDNARGRVKLVTEHDDKANAFGLVDMLGHVSEWCQDSWYYDYQNGPVDHEPRVDEWNPLFVQRGSPNRGWSCRSAGRLPASPDRSSADTGMRLAKSLPRDLYLGLT